MKIHRECGGLNSYVRRNAFATGAPEGRELAWGKERERERRKKKKKYQKSDASSFRQEVIF